MRNGCIWAAITVLLGPTLAVASDAPPEKLTVLVSVLPQAYFVHRIAGDAVEVEVLIPPGASPATHAPTIAQMKAVSQAALYVKVGHPNFPFERAWFDKLAKENPDLIVVDGSAGIDRLEGDPHVWVSPSCVRVMVQNIEAALAELLPAHAEEFAANRDVFLNEIATLDADIREALAGTAGRKFFVFHPAWGYFAAEYGLVQVSIEHEHKEPSPQHLAHLIEHAREENARVIFVQPQFPRQSAELVADELGGSVVPADPLAEDWLTGMREMAAALRKAFAP